MVGNDTQHPLTDATDICLHVDTPLLRVVEVIDLSLAKIALIIDDDKRLVGSVTDGDVRRGLLRGCGLDAPVKDVMHKNPYTLPESATRQHILEMMQAMGIKQVPLVRPDRTVAGVVTHDDLLGQSYAPRPNRVVIMAGGKGTRLLPLTTHIPKPMVEINGRPMLEWILHRFINQGFVDFHICINHLGHIIEDYFGDGSKLACHITYVREKEFLGTAGALSLMDRNTKEPIVVINGDIVASIDFASIVEYHMASGALATVCVRQHRVQVPYGVVEIKDGMLHTIVEKPVHEDLVSAGIYVLEPEALARVPQGQHIDMPNLLLQLVQEKEKVSVFPMREQWIDVGRHDDLEQAKLTMVGGA